MSTPDPRSTTEQMPVVLQAGGFRRPPRRAGGRAVGLVVLALALAAVGVSVWKVRQLLVPGLGARSESIWTPDARRVQLTIPPVRDAPGPAISVLWPLSLNLLSGRDDATDTSTTSTTEASTPTTVDDHGVGDDDVDDDNGVDDDTTSTTRPRSTTSTTVDDHRDGGDQGSDGGGDRSGRRGGSDRGGDDGGSDRSGANSGKG